MISTAVTRIVWQVSKEGVVFCYFHNQTFQMASGALFIVQVLRVRMALENTLIYWLYVIRHYFNNI